MTNEKDAMDKTAPAYSIAKDVYQARQMGDCLLQRHQSLLSEDNLLDEALNAYSRASEELPNNALLTSRMAKVFFLKGQYERATTLAQKALRLLENGSESVQDAKATQQQAYYVLGMIQYRSGQFQLAERFLSHARRIGGLQSAHTCLAQFQNYRDHALDNLKCPTSLILGVKAIATLLTGLILLPFEQERPTTSQLLLLTPRLLICWLLEESHREEAALSRYLAIAENYPGLSMVSLIIGDMCREKGKMEQARQCFEAIIRRHPGHLDAHYHLAQLLEQEESYQAMADVYLRLNQLKPNDPHIHCNLANAYYYLQDYKMALTYYETALQLGKDPEWKGMVAQSIGNLMFDYVQNPQAALAYYQLACALDPGNVENYIQSGMIYFHNEDYENAELVYRKAIAISPKSPKLYSNLGYLRWLAGDAKGAIAFYEKAISLDCGYEIPINNLGVIYLDMLGDVHKAIDLFKQAIDLDENYSLAYYNLGRAYSFLDQRLEAAHCFQMAQELNQFSHDLDSDELAARIQHLFETCELELLD